MHYDTSLYYTGFKEKIDVNKAIFWSTVSEINLQEPIFFCQKYPLLSYPFLFHLSLLRLNSDIQNPQNF